MGKGDRRGKLKPRPDSIPALAPVKPKQPRAQGKFAKPSEDLARAALDARCHQFGVVPSMDARRALAGQAGGHPLGMVLLRECRSQEEVSRLWTAFQGFCQAERTYRLRYLGSTGAPKGANIAMMPERVETDQGHSVDLRTGDEKDHAAVTNWMRWRGYLGHLDAARASLIHRAERGDGKPLWQDKAPTVEGLLTMAAIEALANVIEKDAARKTKAPR